MLGKDLVQTIIAAARSGRYASLTILQRKLTNVGLSGEILAALGLGDSFISRLSKLDPRFKPEYVKSFNVETISFNAGEYGALLKAIPNSSVVVCDIPISPCSCIKGNPEHGKVQQIVAEIKMAAIDNALRRGFFDRKVETDLRRMLQPPRKYKFWEPAKFPDPKSIDRGIFTIISNSSEFQRYLEKALHLVLRPDNTLTTVDNLTRIKLMEGQKETPNPELQSRP